MHRKTYVCFLCRLTSRGGGKDVDPRPEMLHCRNCGTPMVMMSSRFRAPKRNDAKAWFRAQDRLAEATRRSRSTFICFECRVSVNDKSSFAEGGRMLLCPNCRQEMGELG